ncbi:MAG TPA: substrate-binding domain-containing protein [Thermoguttaceae bacterium]|nr:substrate-binding domain-containing protein [Thermoguttaceae bacterium]
MTSNAKSVALMFPAQVSHLEVATQGIADFARQHGGWTFFIRPESYTVSLQSLEGWNGDGVIALIDSEAETQAASRLSMPMVNLSGALRDSGSPRVMADHERIGRVAAEHLLRCGFRRFAYYGLDDFWYSELRCKGFAERIAEEGHSCTVFTMNSSLREGRPWHFGRKELEGWLPTLDGPVGILACDDFRARMVVESCVHLNLEVPGFVGIVGVNNEELVCEFCTPQLSSVVRNDYEIGFQAAALLNRLMHGEAPPEQDILVPPGGVHRRQSTDIVGVNDPYVAAAVRFIRENLDQQFGVKQVAAQVSVSRRCLEQGFRAQLGCTPYEYLSRLRVERAKQLLAGTTRLKINQIARACGFNNPLQLRRAFHRATGTTPKHFRETP